MKSANYFGSITQSSTVLVGSDSATGEEIFIPMKSMLPMVMSCKFILIPEIWLLVERMNQSGYHSIQATLVKYPFMIAHHLHTYRYCNWLRGVAILLTYSLRPAEPSQKFTQTTRHLLVGPCICR